jgi:hypothetical protein
MRFGLGVAFEAVFVSALLFADLTIPSEPLKSFAAHLIRDIFARSDLRSWHVVNRWRFLFRRSLKVSCARSMKTVSPSVEGEGARIGWGKESSAAPSAVVEIEWKSLSPN